VSVVQLNKKSTVILLDADGKTAGVAAAELRKLGLNAKTIAGISGGAAKWKSTEGLAWKEPGLFGFSFGGRRGSKAKMGGTQGTKKPAVKPTKAAPKPVAPTPAKGAPA
jgi:hypothetical protein